MSFVFSYIWVWIHITIRRFTVLFYPKFMYLVLMLYLFFSWDFVWCLVRFCVCYILMLCRCSPLIFNAFPQFWFVTPILFFVHRFTSFEQRYTTVAFIYDKMSTENDINLTTEVLTTGLVIPSGTKRPPAGASTQWCK